MEQIKLSITPTSAPRTYLEEPRSLDGVEYRTPQGLQRAWSLAQEHSDLPMKVAHHDGWKDAKALDLFTDRTRRGAKVLTLRVEIIGTGTLLDIVNRESLRIAKI